MYRLDSLWDAGAGSKAARIQYKRGAQCFSASYQAPDTAIQIVGEPIEGGLRSVLRLAEDVKSYPHRSYHTNECIGIPSGKRLFVAVEAQAGSPE